MSTDTPSSVPHAALAGAAALLILALGASATARVFHWHAATPAPAVAVRVLRLHFIDRDDGAVEIRDADHADSTIRTVPPGTNGFLRGVLRGLARGRRSEHVGPEVPFTLTRWADGEMTLTDPATGQRISLEVFGPTNSRPFAQLLSDPTFSDTQGSPP